MLPEQSHVFGTMYARHHGWLQGLLRKKLGCQHKAEDLAHDTFLKVLVSGVSTALKEPRVFLTTVAHGLVVSHWRRQDLERAYLDAVAQQPLAAGGSAEDRALALEALDRVDALLTGLPAKARRAFLLAQLDGL